MMADHKALLLCLLLTGCTGSDDATSPPTPSAEQGHVSSGAVDAAADIDWFDGSIDAAFALAAAEGKPVFLYWGAQWCPPCHELKAYVFSRPEFRDRMRQFVAFYLDGDAPGAQRLAEEFGVIGYPTVVVMDSTRHEIARIAGGMDLSRYGDVLGLVLETVRPTAEIFATLQSTQAVSLDERECRRLAYNGWILDSRAEQPAALAGALVRGAEACPASLQRERDRLMLTAAALAASAEQAPIQAGAQPSDQLRHLVEAVNEIVADTSRALGNGDAALYFDAPYFVAAKALQPDATEALLAQWLTLMTALQSDARYSAPQQLQAMAMKLLAATSLGQSGGALESLQADAREMLDAYLARDYDEHARVGIINAALGVTQNLNDRARTLAILEPEIEHSKAPYYYMLDMADLEESAGRSAQAVDWLDRAYHSAQGPATRFQWGALYVQGLLRMTPDDVSRIQSAALEVSVELDGTNRIYQRTRMRLAKLIAALRDWSTVAERKEAFDTIRDQMERSCRPAPTADPSAGTCDALFSA